MLPIYIYINIYVTPPIHTHKSVSIYLSGTWLIFICHLLLTKKFFLSHNFDIFVNIYDFDTSKILIKKHFFLCVIFSNVPCVSDG